MTTEAPRHWLTAAFATALAYAAAGLLALLVAIPPGYATPLYPAAGIALVSTLIWGPRMLPGVWLGGFLVNLSLSSPRDGTGLDVLLLPVAIGIGAALEAWIGARLVRRFSPDLLMSEPIDLLRFFGLGGAVACVVSPTVAVLSMLANDTIQLSGVVRTWTTWWLGDAIGVVIAAPIVLALVGRPSAVWRPRRRTVALPMLAITLLAGVAIVQARHWDDSRARAVFERDVATAVSAVTLQLQQPTLALEALRSLFSASDEVSIADFRAATLGWSQMPNPPQAFGFSRFLQPDQIAAAEARLRADGRGDDYRVFDRGPAGERLAVTSPEIAAIQLIEPLAGNDTALGVNAMSIPAAREAIVRARDSGRPAASRGFRLTQEAGEQIGVVVYARVPNDFEASRSTSTQQGVVFVTLRMDDLLRPAVADLPDYVHLCLEDIDGPVALTAAAECQRIASMRLHHSHPIEFGQRRWVLQIGVDSAGITTLGHQDTWLFAIVSLLAAASFGSLLLAMTGRAQRIEAAVGERTAALQREIAERSRTEAALRDSEQRFRNILDHVPIGLIYTDLQGHIKQSNPKFREMVGLGAEQLSRMRAADITHPEDLVEDTALLKRLVAGDISVFERQQRFVRADGKVIWVRSIVSLLRDVEGRPHRIVGAVEDITEHLQLEEAQAGRELAEAANRAKNEFLSRMSHELRTPLNAMLGFAQLVELDRRQPLSVSQREWVGQIQKAGWHLLEMINDTLDLSRIESGTLKLSIEAMDLTQVIAGTLSMVERSAQARRLRVSHTVAQDAAQITGDPTRVKQILTNLLTNAVKYNVDGGLVHIDARPTDEGEVAVSVTDSGLGLTEAQLAALFQPFNRLGRERSSQEGTGIGLVISQRLAELMNGRLEVSSVAGEGSTFTLTLPRAAPRELSAATLTATDPVEPDYRQRIVHYIEDNETNAVVMEGILARRPQVKLRVSPTGLEGLSAVRARPPSLILLDMHLPDIDGLQLLRLLKDDLATAGIPVVAVSADAVTTRIQSALEIGAEYYLTKPVNVAELLRIVDEVLEPRDTLFG